MTVTAGPSAHRLEYAGATYYFCRAACRREFESNPDAYLKKESRC
jgi:YHS domain-containing protein